MNKSDYSGLYNRSAHTAQLKIFYNQPKTGWGGSIRWVYRSRFGVLDIDGNGFSNMDDEFADGLLQMHATLSKQFNKEFTVQAGVNNILNQTNARWMPNIPGINWFISLQIHFSHKTNQQ
jgi:outer membrane receptor for ferrienterochelin and colicins